MTAVCLHDPSSVRNRRDCVHCLRRDLATRDRELAEVREQAAEVCRLADAYNEKYNVAEREFDQARAALAEKEREVEVLRKSNCELSVQCQADIDARYAAQEEAKGLRTALVAIRDHEDHDEYCYGCRHRKEMAINALAARQQQQPDGKPDPAPVARETPTIEKVIDLMGALKAALTPKDRP